MKIKNIITSRVFSALHLNEFILVHDHRRATKTPASGRVVNRVNQSSFRQQILQAVPDEVQGLDRIGFEHT